MDKSNRTTYRGRMLNFAAALIAVSVLFACGGGGSSIAGTGDLTAAQFETMLKASPTFQGIVSSDATLTSKVSRLPFGIIKKPGSASSTEAVTLSTTPDFGTCTDVGLLIGNAVGANAALGQVSSRITCKLYEYSYSANDGTIASLAGMEWDGANCSGSAFATQVITQQLAQNGYVFSMPGQSNNFAVAAGSSSQVISVMSQSDNLGNCTDNSGSPFNDHVYAIVANDPQVTGVPNSAVPVKITNGGN